MAAASDATANRCWTPLLLTAAVLLCLLAVVGGLGSSPGSMDRAGTVAAMAAAESLQVSGIPAPDRAPVAVHACAAAEKEAENGRPDPAERATSLPSCMAGTRTAASPAAWAMPAIRSRPLRSHLSQAPPARA